LQPTADHKIGAVSRIKSLNLGLIRILKMERRGKLSNFLATTFGLAVTLGVAYLLAIILIFFLSKDPGRTIYYFFLGPFTNMYYFGNMLNASVPVALAGLGIIIAFKSSMFNLGGEGQIYSGALVVTAVCLALPGMNGYLGVFLGLAAGMAAGGILAGLSGFLKMKWGTNELISSFMISGAAVLIVNYFITGPMDDPINNLLATCRVGDQYCLMRIFRPSNLNIGAVLAILMTGLVYFLMYYTRWGYEIRMCGENREFARYGGINISVYMVLPMILSGALQGLAGGVVVLGTHHMVIKEFTIGIGWKGIAVALVARNQPLGAIPAAILFAYLDAGAKAAMIHSDVTYEISSIIQSIIFYLVTAQAIYSFVSRRRKEKDPA